MKYRSYKFDNFEKMKKNQTFRNKSFSTYSLLRSLGIFIWYNLMNVSTSKLDMFRMPSDTLANYTHKGK